MNDLSTTIVGLWLFVSFIMELFMIVNFIEDKGDENPIIELIKKRFSVFKDIKEVWHVILAIIWLPCWGIVTLLLILMFVFWKIFGKLLIYKFR